ncbi:MAG: glucose-6-phosphate isomerase family protein [Silvibacterium sp.]
MIGSAYRFASQVESGKTAMTLPPQIAPANAHVDWLHGRLEGSFVQERKKTFSQLRRLFQNAASDGIDPNTVVYRVRWWEPVPPNTEGGLFWGVTEVEAGQVGGEYFMTQGHFHAKRDRAEYYGTIEGFGMLILMNKKRETWAEVMSPGSLHYIPGGIAHRVANTGDMPLSFWACWPSDAGHDYAAIEFEGFGARMMNCDGSPALVPEN